ncbi:uncharacterized protein LOC113665473 [Pocillopora damicornis]|nr:uncharacterized protein LOC113665473 [Pocillopora damicornis]
MSSLNQKVDWTPSKVNVNFGQYKKTSHWYANISWTPLNETYGNWSGIVVKLTVKNAHPILKGVYPSSCSQHPKNQTFLQVNLSSYGYLFPDVIYLRILALPYSPKEDISDVLSFKPPVPTSSSLVNQTTAGSNKVMKYMSSSVGIVAGVLAVVLAGVCHKTFTRICLQHRGSRYSRPSGDIEPENHEVFIIFNGDDNEWVKDELLPLLEGQHGFKCRVHYRDFRAGGVIYELMSDSISKSYKNVVVYSRNFLKSGFCDFELNQAKHRLLRKNDDSLVIIRKDDVDLRSLPEDLRERSVIDYGSNHEKPHWERKLIEFLKKPNKNRHESQIQ